MESHTQKSWFDHTDIVDGGEFVFNMGATPNQEWGQLKADRPFTQEFKPTVVMPFIITNDNQFITHAKVKLECKTKGSKIYYTIDGSEPNENSSLYTAPFKLDKTTDLKFVAYKKRIAAKLNSHRKIIKT